MNKAIVNMTNWELDVYDDEYSLSGTADHHPKLGNHTYVSQTSALIGYSFADDVLTYETRNTIYMCPLKYILTWPYQYVEVETRVELAHRADMSESVLDQIVSATAKLSILETKKVYEDPGKRIKTYYEALCNVTEDYSDDDFLSHIQELQRKGQMEIEEMTRKENTRLMELAGKYEDCVYLEVSNVGSGDLLAYHLGKYTGVVQPDIHVGMFQDSILYMKYGYDDEEDSLDFRYFPKGMNEVMETYSWSDNIKYAVIKNETGDTLIFNRIKIPEGETMVFTPESHREGLISPDCYNGKSIFGRPGKGE
jgi:hypothetical protein